MRLSRRRRDRRSFALPGLLALSSVGAAAGCADLLGFADDLRVETDASTPDGSSPPTDAPSSTMDGAVQSDSALDAGEDASMDAAADANGAIDADAAASDAETDGEAGRPFAWGVDTIDALGGIAVLNGNLYVATTDGVRACALPACASFHLVYPESEPATLLSLTAGHLAWYLPDGNGRPPAVHASGLDGGATVHAFPLTTTASTMAPVFQIAVVNDGTTRAFEVVVRETGTAGEQIVASFGEADAAATSMLFKNGPAISMSSANDQLVYAATSDTTFTFQTLNGGWTNASGASCSGTNCSVVTAIVNDAVTGVDIATFSADAGAIESFAPNNMTSILVLKRGRISLLDRTGSQLVWVEGVGATSKIFACDVATNPGSPISCTPAPVGTLGMTITQIAVGTDATYATAADSGSIFRFVSDGGI